MYSLSILLSSYFTHHLFFTSLFSFLFLKIFFLILFLPSLYFFFFFLNDTPPPEIYPLSLHAPLPIPPRAIIWAGWPGPPLPRVALFRAAPGALAQRTQWATPVSRWGPPNARRHSPSSREAWKPPGSATNPPQPGIFARRCHSWRRLDAGSPRTCRTQVPDPRGERVAGRACARPDLGAAG